MKVIDLLEKADMDDLEFIDIFSKDEDGLCGVVQPDRWREFLPEKVLNSEVFKFSPNYTSSEPGLNIYIKDEESKLETFCENDIVGFTKEDEVNLSNLLEGLHKQIMANEKKHNDTVDSSIFAKQELDKVIIKQKSLVDEIEEIIKNNPDTVIQVTFGGSKICVMVYSNYLRATNFKNLSLHTSVKDILDAIKDLVRLAEKEEKENGCMD